MNATTETETIRLGNGPAYFAPRGKLADTLFGRGGTATGEYRALKGAIVFYTADGSPRVALITNKYGERFYVSARRFNGRIRYLFGLNDADANWAGLPDGRIVQADSAARVAEQLGR